VNARKAPLIAIVLLLFTGLDRLPAGSMSLQTQIVDVKEKQSYKGIRKYPLVIMHAGGAIDGITGSNSRNAIDNSYMRGIKYIELDFNWTSDGNLVLVHDWDQMKRFCPGIPPDKIPTLKEFLDTKIVGRYESMDLDKLAQWLENHEDVSIITDIKIDNIKALELIKNKHPEIIKQVIPQIYSYREFDKVNALGYKRIILSLYMMKIREKTDTKTIIKFAKTKEIFAVAMAKELIDIIEDEEEYFKNNIAVYVHTTNSLIEARKIIQYGFAGVYSDSLSPNDFGR
jgi:glycerophosphoryl diester phosphodiesterase